MGTSGGKTAKGIALSGASTGTIGQLLSVQFGAQKCEFTDVSDQDVADSFRKFLPTMLTAGEITVKVNHDGATSGVAAKLNTTFQGKSMETWTVTGPTGDAWTWACSGGIEELGGPEASDTMTGKIEQSIKIKLSGKPTFTPVAA